MLNQNHFKAAETILWVWTSCTHKQSKLIPIGLWPAPSLFLGERSTPSHKETGKCREVAAHGSRQAASPCRDGRHFHRWANTHLGSFSTMRWPPCHFWNSMFDKEMEYAPSGFQGWAQGAVAWVGTTTHSTHWQNWPSTETGVRAGQPSGTSNNKWTVINECTQLDLMIPKAAGH